MAGVPRHPRPCAARSLRSGGGRRGDLVRARGVRATGLALRRGGSAAHQPADFVRARRRERCPLVPLRRDAPAAAGLAAVRRRVRPARYDALHVTRGPSRHGRGACGLLGTPPAPSWSCLVAPPTPGLHLSVQRSECLWEILFEVATNPNGFQRARCVRWHKRLQGNHVRLGLPYGDRKEVGVDAGVPAVRRVKLTPPGAQYSATLSRAEKSKRSIYTVFVTPCKPVQRIYYNS